MKKVMVGMSGGVDSSVAAMLLRDRGYEVMGVTLKLFSDEDISEAQKEGKTCCALSDVEDARSVAYRLGFEHLVFNFKDNFREHVMKQFADSYISGRTPNPCIECNRHVKFDKMLRRAQELGYAEADPSSDIDGLDIQRKCVISSNVAFGVSIPEEQVPVFGIRNIKACDIDAAKRLGKICKMMAIARQTKDNKITAYVEPVFLPGESLEASVHDAFNLITLEGEYSGVQSFFGQGAGRYPTAYNVVEDCADLLHGIDDFYTDVIEPKSVDNAEELHPYYIRGLRSPETVKALKVINCGEGFISKPISVVEAHTIAESQAGEELFMAGILED